MSVIPAFFYRSDQNYKLFIVATKYKNCVIYFKKLCTVGEEGYARRSTKENSELFHYCSY